ncbi:N-acetyl sugar amidotransferase [Xenorhabdus nematophila]|uniref:N-acetyl sugar amidotransferase n=2 Tax=Xenorhabdus nematophila TaxID=628 RepID=UPI000327577A|nr:N-acetyl sugar amidotransferase [Xenorhabdus nematophila]CEF33700.1 LPS biosynthesis protein WbpG [Xenorhabdus nematophila str. Websteri]AYA41577.1 N-acetyl sugar amidotransferase [Xenorhabdus nematophila]MBA0020316.1 N-acetyl sugar amidotransferase [Xenorhabdus nematophila]MCB4426081.1 N-acetyl sugar amidotransferase [Xenorhabdus nematophila]QNJ35968.1 N-acetyl sugar amidotransferase [Xenorhabdus nematophila]
MKNSSFHICAKCVMDTTDPEITFDHEGVCNHCHQFDDITSTYWFPNEQGHKKLSNIFENIRKERKNFEYDCIIGLSGGLDSSYLALVMKDYGLRPLVVHVDAGWNSELAVHNIEKIVKYCDYDLHTHVMNWPEIRDLQLSYLKAGIANQDAVQDHAFFASLYHFAIRHKINYVISGGNIATEAVFPNSWHHSAMDATNLKAIHKKFGSIPLKEYQTISFMQYYFYYPFIKNMQVIRPLNYIQYSKELALSELKEKVGYKPYERKHGESRFTKFFQNYYLPVKFNIDKRKPHLSSMILSGLITREHALKELELPLYDDHELREDKYYIAKKLGVSTEQLDEYIFSSGHNYDEYPNWDSKYAFMKKIQNLISKTTGHHVKKYS